MANLIVYPRFKAFNIDGTVLASGKVYTYITGTSTPKTTYTNAGAGTPNANPVILDAHGEADIWGAVDAAYRIVIKDSSDSVISTTDNINPIQNPQTLGANLDTNGFSIVSTGSNDITLTPYSGRYIILNGVKLPTSAPSANQVLKATSSTATSWVSLTTDILTDTTPQLGGNLDTNNYNITFNTGTGLLDSSANEQILFTTTASAVNYINITNSATTGAPIIAAAGSDSNVSLSLSGKGTGTVKLSGISYPTADGTAGQGIVATGSSGTQFATISGTLVQRQYSAVLTVSTLTTQIPLDDTAPQNTEGDQITTVTITPTSATNRLRIKAIIPFFSASSAATVCAALFQDSTANALNAAAIYAASTDPKGPLKVEWDMAAGTTSATTFKLRSGPSSGVTVYTLANSAGTRRFGGVAAVYLTVDEVVP